LASTVAKVIRLNSCGPGDVDRRVERLVEADALEHRVGAVPAGQLLRAFDRFGTAFTDEVSLYQTETSSLHLLAPL
jgi:hypothetical protein